MPYLAIVKAENNKIAKYQDFELKLDADAHVVTYGGFAVETPASGSMDYWVVDAVAKTITHDTVTQTTDEAATEMVEIRREAVLLLGSLVTIMRGREFC